MAQKIDLQAQQWCEQVFTGRNKAYGAFFLRQRYGKTVVLAVSLAIISFSLVVGLPVLIQLIGGTNQTETVFRVVDTNDLMAPPPIDKTAPPPPPPSAPPPPPVRSTVKFTPPVIKKDAEVKPEEPPPVQEEIKVEVSIMTVEGTDDSPPPIEEPQIGDGDNIVEDPNQLFLHVEESPMPDGGLSAFYKYVGRTVRYPAPARESGIQGRVYVQFVVEKDGSITDVKVTKGVGAGCDQEAIRVVRGSPKWKPGKQNGKPVRVQYSIPIIFKLE